MPNVFDSLYEDLNTASDFRTKLSPAILFKGKYEAPVVDCILKNTFPRNCTQNTLKLDTMIDYSSRRNEKIQLTLLNTPRSL